MVVLRVILVRPIGHIAQVNHTLWDADILWLLVLIHGFIPHSWHCWVWTNHVKDTAVSASVKMLDRSCLGMHLGMGRLHGDEDGSEIKLMKVTNGRGSEA